MKRKIVSICLVLVMVLGSMGFAFAAEDVLLIAPNPAAQEKDDKIVILYTNDVHCGIEDGLGYAGLAAYKAAKLAETDYVTLVDAGDSIQGEAIGTISDGKYIADIMKFVGYDIAVPGNHEFDYGMDNFLEIAKNAPYTYICSNFVDKETGKSVFDAYTIMTYGDVKVGYVGIDTPETFVKSTPTYFQDGNGNYIYDFCNDLTGEKLYANVQASVDALEAEGVDYIIAVGHLGTDAESAPWRSTDVIANTDGIDAFIDGHSHSTIAGDKVKNKAGEEVVLTSTGTKLAAIGEMVIDDGVITTGLVTEFADKDADTVAYIEGIKAGYEALLNQVVAKTEVELTIKGADGNRAVRKAETNLGDLCADAYRAMLDADIAFVNGGGVRDNIDIGDITYEEIIAVHPFGNVACKVEATGQEIIDALEMGAKAAPGENGGFLQVSGLSYKINTDIASTVVTDETGAFVGVEGARRVQDVMVDGKPIELDRIYTLASHNYMLKSGGDGFVMFMDNKILLDEVMIDNQVLINYIVDELDGVVGQEYAKAQGRITYTDNLPFTDLKGYGWARDAVKYVYDNGMFTGTGDTTFAPGTDMTRGMLMTVLARLDGVDTTGGDKWYTKGVEWAVENELSDGTNPTGKVTREQFVTILYRYAQYKGIDVSVGEDTNILSYNDALEITEYAIPAIQWACGAGVVEGDDNANLNPKDGSTRAAAATMLMRFDGIVKAQVAEE
ncbi:MAG: 5'-nucleotidase C-terminal domain-containing protein [Firmicutes bacterium]|nr:5'-nucleotidase C-terminal domain-containing protein [Bacillota bacterium]